MDHAVSSVRNETILFIELAIADADSAKIHFAKNRKGGKRQSLCVFFTVRRI